MTILKNLLEEQGANPYYHKARIGTANGEVELTETGIEFKGTAIRYDDIQGSALILPTGGWGGANIELDEDENTIVFHANGDLSDSSKRAIMNYQFYHNQVYGAGAYFRQHFHWFQKDTTQRTMKMQYRKVKYGVALGSWVTIEVTTNDGHDGTAYIGSGTMPNVTEFPEIDVTDMGLSDILQVRFARTDSESGDLDITYFDPHVKINDNGSRQEWSK